MRPEALYDRPIPERHRIIFYLGHLEAFDWNLLRGPLGLSSLRSRDSTSSSPSASTLWTAGCPTDQPERLALDGRRSALTTHGCARSTGQLADDCLRKDPDLACLEHGRLLEVAIEHRLMHAETLCYMLHQLPLDRKFAPADARIAR